MRSENYPHRIKLISGAFVGDSCLQNRELHTIFYLCFLVLLVYFLVFTFVSLIKILKIPAATMGSNENTKLCDFTSHNNSDLICTPIAPPATSAPSYEIKPALLNHVMKDQFSGAGEDAALHLNNFV